MKTSSFNNYCLKRITIRMSDLRTYYTTNYLTELRDDSNNNEILYMEHINDDECNWDIFYC